RDGLIAGVSIPDADADPVTYSQPLATPGVVDVDINRACREELTGLPGPGEMTLCIATQAPGEDLFEQSTLLHRGPRIHIQNPRPWRARLVVAVTRGDRDGDAREIGSVGLALLDQPRENPKADAV